MLFEISDEASDDIKKLPNDKLKRECLDTLKSLRNGRIRGQRLENKNGRDLSDCFKLYFDEARYRIVYQIEPECLIIGVGPRDEEEIYRVVANRLGR